MGATINGLGDFVLSGLDRLIETSLTRVRPDWLVAVTTWPPLAMIIVIQTFFYPQAWTEHLLWASVLVFLLVRGPGALSFDHLIERWIERNH